MNFFEEQHRARKRTGLLVVLYLTAVVGLILGVYVAVVLGLVMAAPDDGPELVEIGPEVFPLTAAGVLLVVAGGSLWKIRQLAKGGGPQVATDLGGRAVDRSTTDPEERRLLNTVDEMAIAAGIPAPAVYILDDEPGLNAFAAGFAPSDAVVAVTRGLLDTLTRDELQGVIAHEISHVVNGDMRLNMRLSGVLFGILMVALVGRIGLRMGGGRGRGNGAAAIAGLGMVVAGYFGVLCGRLIQASVSRQREYLADAAAVQFTRYPHGIGGALARIGAADAGSRIGSARAADAGHFLFASGVKRWFGGLSSHPPLKKRIDRILPGGVGLRLLEDYKAGRIPDVPSLTAEVSQQGPPPADVAKATGTGGAAAPFDPWRFAAGLGALASGALIHARQLRESLAPGLATALESAGGARLIALAMVLDDDPESRARQDAVLGADAAAVAEHAAALVRLPAPARLDVLHLAAPSLRNLEGEGRTRFLADLNALVAADGRTDALEIAVLVILERLFAAPDGSRGGAAPDAAKTRLLTGALLSSLACLGAPDDPEMQRAAFVAAVSASGVFAADAPPTLGDHAAEALPEALHRLSLLPPLQRQGIIAACAVAIGHDGTVTDDEALVLRAACEAMDCPVPPILMAGDEELPAALPDTALQAC